MSRQVKMNQEKIEELEALEKKISALLGGRAFVMLFMAGEEDTDGHLVHMITTMSPKERGGIFGSYLLSDPEVYTEYVRHMLRAAEKLHRQVEKKDAH